MLQYLHIKNLAVMGKANLDFEPGFAVVTGETGAGKSVLLGALSFLAGARVDKTIIRTGAAACEVEAGLFFKDCGLVDSVLESLGLPLCEEGCLILRRVFAREKMPRVQINGSLTTLASLVVIGECWVDFHGPGEPQKLFMERWQRELLDVFAKNGARLVDYKARYGEWKGLLKEADTLRGQKQLSPEESEFLQSQLDLIDQAGLSEASVELLERDFQRLSRSQELIELATGLEVGLNAEEEGVSARMGSLLGAAREIASIEAGAKAESLAARLESLIIEAEDLGGEFASLRSGCEFNGEAAAELKEKMDNWLELKRKYGPDARSVLARREKMANKISTQGDVTGNIERLEYEAEVLQKKLVKLAKKISVHRSRAANSLVSEASRILKDLGFKNPVLKIEITRQETLREHGDGSCWFLFAPNAGQEPLPLRKIASSGEIARLMLALKAVLARADTTPVLVFDEVDANVGGETAVAVGEKLAQLGERHQVFCVTHLPQVAAKASSHWLVEKTETRTGLSVSIKAIQSEKGLRRRELARMLGDRSSKKAMAHAAELLS